MKKIKKAVCFDCDLSYEDPGFQDLIVPDWAWSQISPSGGEGLLCPTCICRRLAETGIKNCPSMFTSGALAPKKKTPELSENKTSAFNFRLV